MTVNDSEPRYRLEDANGNAIGTLFAEGDGTLVLQEGTSGNQNELSLATDGTASVPALDTDSATISSMFAVDSTSVTVSSGAVSADGTLLIVDGEGGSADDLETINNPSAWEIVILRKGNADITVKDNVGNINLAGADFTLGNGLDRLMLQYDDNSGIWVELSRAQNV